LLQKKMRALFVTNRCPPCRKVSEAVMRANITLPLEFKIDIINIYSGDPRTKVLAEIYGSDDPNNWLCPVIVFDRPAIRRRFGRIVKGTQRVVIFGYQGQEHLVTFLNKLI